MGCSKKMSVKIPTTKRCNEMIKEFQGWINNKYKTSVKYSKEERLALIKEIKSNPTHCWILGDESLIHFGI